jgi:hypothetical protein
MDTAVRKCPSTSSGPFRYDRWFSPTLVMLGASLSENPASHVLLGVNPKSA